MMDNLVSVVLGWVQAIKALLLAPVCWDLSVGWVFIWTLWGKASLGELSESPLTASPTLILQTLVAFRAFVLL